MDHTSASASARPRTQLLQLSGEDVETFMKNDWHRNARLFRNAIPDFSALCSIDDLLDLACNPDAEARLIENREGHWSLTRGPLDELPSRQQPAWTVLIQGLNLMLEPAAQLLERFRFVPEARLDDLMVSFATDGGGVGPHFDSYDVFLLQMHGQRRWRISAQSDLEIHDDLPLKILKRFEPEQEFILNPGDMLYLPPRYAHDGVAIGECTTLSIGFRAPTAAELLSSVLHQLADDICNDPALCSQRFADPQRGSTTTPGQLPADLLAWTHEKLAAFAPGTDGVEKGLLIERTEPKDTVFFDTPARAPTPRGVHRTLTTRGIELHRASRLIYGRSGFALNGEWFANFGDAAADQMLRTLADERRLTPAECAALQLTDAFTQWCTAMLDAGWLQTPTR